MATTTRSRWLSLFACALLLSTAGTALQADDGRDTAAAAGTSRAWPLWFEPAAGDDAFVVHGAGYQVALTERGPAMTVGGVPVQLSFVGGRTVAPRAERATRGVSHHFVGNDPARWRRDVPHFEAVRYPAVYPGIDVLFYAAQDAAGASRVEYDFVVAPGADPRAIAVRLAGVADIAVDESGQLVARNGAQAVVQRRPVAFQEIDGTRRPVDVTFEVNADVVRFRLGDYDPRHTLTIDPIVVVFGTFVGGSGQEFVQVGAENGGIAVNDAGAVFVAGDTTSPFLDLGGAPTVLATPNVFVVKVNAEGTVAEFAVFVGGSGNDSRARLALAPDGGVFVAGVTTSTDFPTTANAIKGTPPGAGSSDGFLVRLGAGGALTYATYLGGTAADAAEGLAVRGTAVAVVGSTSSRDLHVTANAAQPAPGGVVGDFDAWVAVIETSPAPALAYGSYLGGASTDAAFAVGFDGAGRVVVAGLTDSANFPVSAATALQATRSGARDAFLARFVPSTGSRDYATYFGGTGVNGESATRLAIDSAGRVYVAGVTDSTDLPAGLTPAFQADNAGGFDGFVAHVNPDALPGLQLLYRTYLGGSQNDAVLAMTIDALDHVSVGGYTLSANFPVVGALQGTKGAAEDGFVARLSASGATLDFSTFVGGEGTDLVLGLAHRSGFGLYLLGQSSSTAPLTLKSASGPALDGSRGGTNDAFVARLDVGPLVAAIVPASGSTAGGTPVTITGLDFAPGATVTIGGAAATSVIVASSNAITAIAPAGVAGPRDVVVSNPNGSSSTLPVAFTYVPPGAAPTIGSVTPNEGVILGGQQVTIAGSGFANGATVFFGDTPATNVVVQTAASIVATTPARAPGTVPVSVVNPDLQSGSLPSGFSYLTDFDGDQVADTWEVANGLDPTNPADAGLDNDRDGANNRKEFQDGTDPNAAITRYFAEGATGFFATRFALMNDDETRQATVTFEFLVKDGPVLTATRTIGPRRRITLDAAADVAGLSSAQFSTSIRSNLPIAADRTMTWTAATYGAHSETAVAAPASTWYLAEGSTGSGLQLFYLIQNPNPVAVDVTVRFLLLGGSPVQKQYTVGPQTRETIWVNLEEAEGVSLNDKQLSAVLSTAPSTPIIVERAMYLDTDNGATFWGAGHESAGITQPATRWLLAEGATHSGFNLFVLIANPNAQPANLTLTYLLREGPPVVRTMTVDGNRRETVWVDLDPELSDVDVSTIVESDVPVVVERAMWWPGPLESWYEAHNSAGATATARKWLVAEGEVGPFGQLDSFILLANTSGRAGTANVTLVFEDGTAPVTQQFQLGANSRENVWVGVDIGGAALIGKRFGAIVESVGIDPVELVVERAMYWSTGRFFEAGTNSLASPR